MTPLFDHPHLPLLTLAQCFKAFSAAGVPLTQLHHLVGMSRMALYKWRTGKAKPYQCTLNHVSKLAYKCLRELERNELPLPSSASPKEYSELLARGDRDQPLSELTAAALLKPLIKK